MMLIKIEIHPGGDASRAREIRRIKIANMGEDSTRPIYQCVLFDSEEKRVIASRMVRHVRSDGAVRLVEIACQALGVRVS